MIINHVARTSKKDNIAQHEIAALQIRHNLVDAHTHRNQSVSQKYIMGMLPEIWCKSQDITQKEPEEIFINEFFKLHQQRDVLERVDDFYLVCSASIAINITTACLAKNI